MKPFPNNILIEVQRRKGCSVTFHNYRRFILDAAEGKFDPTSFHETDGLEKPFGRDLILVMVIYQFMTIQVYIKLGV